MVVVVLGVLGGAEGHGRGGPKVVAPGRGQPVRTQAGTQAQHQGGRRAALLEKNRREILVLYSSWVGIVHER